MYLVGAPHPDKTEAQIILERLIAAGERLVTDAEVFQEIMHRYAAIGKREAISPAFNVTAEIIDEVISIEKADVFRAAEIARNRTRLSARDSLHIAIMERHGIRSILSFDADFDRCPGLHPNPSRLALFVSQVQSYCPSGHSLEVHAREAGGAHL